MADETQPAPDEPQSRPEPHGFMKLPRMVRVWLILAIAMGVTWVIGQAALPVSAPDEPALVKAPDAGTEAERLIWPETMELVRQWRYIVIHHSATRGATIESIARGHEERLGTDGAGYHFIINNGVSEGTVDGQIQPTARWLQQRPGAHCKVSRHPEFNTEGIGICLVGNFEEAPPTQAQMASLVWLVRQLRARHRVPIEHVFGHGEVATTACPGTQFPMQELLLELRREYIEDNFR